jgi:hypothetical protein
MEMNRRATTLERTELNYGAVKKAGLSPLSENVEF